MEGREEDEDDVMVVDRLLLKRARYWILSLTEEEHDVFSWLPAEVVLHVFAYLQFQELVASQYFVPGIRYCDSRSIITSDQSIGSQGYPPFPLRIVDTTAQN